jgi:hypothetical protein
MMAENTQHLELARRLATEFGRFDEVKAIALGGSVASGAAGPGSDIDLYVFTTAPVPLQKRTELAARCGYTRADLGLEFWDPGDEWMDTATGIEVDVIYWDTVWIEDQLARVLLRHQASMGYTTCFWNTLQKALSLYDPQVWLDAVQQSTWVPYPEELRLNIIRANHAVLRRVIPSYAHQIEKAQSRGDLVSVNHRVAALLASYFDVLFALNRVLHPGEKRLLTFAEQNCPLLPSGFSADVTQLLTAAGSTNPAVVQYTHRLLDHLDELLLSQGFDPDTSTLK